MGLELTNGSRVIALPAGEETIRGYAGVNLLIIDEAARVEDELYYSVRPMLAVGRGRLVALSTPWGRNGWFYHEWSHSTQWRKIRITARDCPRLTEEILEQERESLVEAWFRHEYLCEFVEVGAEGFIYADWLECCADLDLEPSGPLNIGLDVAGSPRGDDTVFCLTQGLAVTSLERYAGQDLMSTCGRAVRLIEQTGARSIRIDDTGVGGGVSDRLREVQREAERGSVLPQCEVVPMGFGKKAWEPERFVDLRTEMWWNLGEQLRHGTLSIPPEPVLFQQLSTPAMLQDSTGRLRLESKDSLRRRGLKSPDMADSPALAVYPEGMIARSPRPSAFVIPFPSSDGSGVGRTREERPESEAERRARIQGYLRRTVQ